VNIILGYFYVSLQRGTGLEAGDSGYLDEIQKLMIFIQEFWCILWMDKTLE
jgi:hypothetical protein